jgi:alpha,alpha-trehalose phosphorylase
LGRRIKVEIDHAEASYTLLEGEPLEIAHFDDPVSLKKKGVARRPIPPPPPVRPAPHQPPGRVPARRAPEAKA